MSRSRIDVKASWVLVGLGRREAEGGYIALNVLVSKVIVVGLSRA